MDYNVFKKTIVTGGKVRHYWYYWYLENGCQIQKACKGCKTMAEAWDYVNKLLPLAQRGFLIRDVAAEMFLSRFKSKLIFNSAKKALAQKEGKA